MFLNTSLPLYLRQVKQKGYLLDRLLAFGLNGIYVYNFERKLMLECPWKTTDRIIFDVRKPQPITHLQIVDETLPLFLRPLESKDYTGCSWSQCDDSICQQCQEVKMTLSVPFSLPSFIVFFSIQVRTSVCHNPIYTTTYFEATDTKF